MTNEKNIGVYPIKYSTNLKSNRIEIRYLGSWEEVVSFQWFSRNYRILLVEEIPDGEGLGAFFGCFNGSIFLLFRALIVISIRSGIQFENL